MADFNIAVQLTIKHEGGYVDNLNDPGGRTNMGITQRDLPDENIQELTSSRAIQWYKDNRWNPLYSQIEDQNFCNKFFDLGVLFGVGTVVGAVQSLLKLKEDFVFGQNTLNAVNQTVPYDLITAFKAAMVSHALNIGAKNPKLRQFVPGWINRINS